MASLLTMPSLSPTMETGVISSWQKKVGDFIEVGEVLAEIETDKAVMEYEMADEGYLREILVEPGTELAVGTPIAILSESPDDDISSVQAQAKQGGDGGQPQAGAAEQQGAPEQPQQEEQEQAAPQPEQQAAPQPAPGNGSAAAQQQAAPAAAPPRGEGERVRISPYARKLAAEKGVDVGGLQGSGPGGRIVAKDVEAAPAGGVQAPSSEAPAAPGQAPAPGQAYEDVPLSMMRRAIARNVAESKQTVPHFQLTRKVRVERMLALRSELNEDFPEQKLSINDLLVKACAAALRRHPEVNVAFLGDKVRYFHSVDIGVAVGSDDGLITPVVRNVDGKGLHAISSEIRELAGRAREKKLSQEEYSGGTFTVSNLGMYGVDEFNAIIVQPQACILAVSAVVKEPVVEGDHLAIGQTMSMTLSSDHRVVDGVLAAQFMDTLARIVENPMAMLV